MENQKIITWLKIILLILIVIAVGIFIINQFFGWYFKAELLMKPCELCKSLNPDNFLIPNVSDTAGNQATYPIVYQFNFSLTK